MEGYKSYLEANEIKKSRELYRDFLSLTFFQITQTPGLDLTDETDLVNMRFILPLSSRF